LLDASAAWLRSEGFVVDVLAGGWQSYRRWVKAGLEMLPRTLDFRVISSSSPDALAAVLGALLDLGEQVIDLGDVGSGSRAALETKLLDDMRHRETDRRLWVSDPSTLGQGVSLPPALVEALRAAPRTSLVMEPRKPSRNIDLLLVEGTDAPALRASVERFLSVLNAQSKP
jgi:tRNA 2-selenouridine synthase